MNRFLVFFCLLASFFFSAAVRAETIYQAVEHNNLPLLRSLVQAEGTLINAKDSDGWTPLAYAARFGRLEIAAFLLAKGAKVDSPDQEGFTPLHQAASYGHVELIRLLLDNGAPINAISVGRVTPMRLARSNGHKKAFQTLKDRGGV